jgi:hypothetical protein
MALVIRAWLSLLKLADGGGICYISRVAPELCRWAAQSEA